MKELEEIITRMDMIQISEFKVMEGNYYVWRAKQLVSVVEMEQGRVADARARMEATLAEQKDYFGGKYHNAMD